MLIFIYVSICCNSISYRIKKQEKMKKMYKSYDNRIIMLDANNATFGRRKIRHVGSMHNTSI